MRVNPHLVGSDRYELARFESISFKCFSQKPVDSETPIRLRQIQTSMLYEQPNLMVQAAGNELWCFSIEADKFPPDPPDNEGLVLVRRGSILPSVGQVARDNAADLEAFLEAVRSRVLNSLCASPDEYAQFGSKVYLRKSGSLLRLTPSLTVTGFLALHLAVEDSKLVPYSRSSKSVWLIPQGKAASVVSDVGTPNLLVARVFYQLIRSLFVINFPDTWFDETRWVRVSVDGQDVIWPANLLVAKRSSRTALQWLGRASAITSMLPTMAELEQESLQLSERLANAEQLKEEPAVGLEAMDMDSKDEMRAYSDATTTTAAVASTAVPTLSVGMPTPRAVTPLETAPKVITPKPAVPVLSVTSRAPSKTPTPQVITTTTTTPAPQKMPLKVLERNWDMNTGDEEDDEDDDEDLTFADFSYFDQPMASNDEPKEAVVKEQSPIPVELEVIEEKQAIPDENPVLELQVCGNAAKFAPVQFKLSQIDSMDMKYSTGGRFFIPQVEEDEQDMSSSSDHDPRPLRSVKLKLNDSPSEDSLLPDSESDAEEPPATTNTLFMKSLYSRVLDADFTSNITGLAAESFDPQITPHYPLISQTSSPDESARAKRARTSFDCGIDENSKKEITSTPINNKQINEDLKAKALDSWKVALFSDAVRFWPDSISDETIQYLMLQAVWDNSHLSDAMDSAMLLKPLKTVADALYSEIGKVFSGVKKLSISEIIVSGLQPHADNGKDYLKPDLHSATIAGQTPSVNSQQPPLQVGASPQPTEEPLFTLLSPPLYHVKRLGQLHKARASILPFWKTFSLQPCTPPRDIMIILLTLSNGRICDAASRFLRFLKATYESCNLGSMTLPTFGSVREGIATISADLQFTQPETIYDLYEAMSAIIKRQIEPQFTDKKILILMAYPSSPKILPLSLARGFQSLRSSLPNVRWMLMALENILSIDGCDMLPSQLEMVKLSMIIYDRWVSKLNIRNVLGEPSIISLARLAPRNLNIKFTTEFPSQLFDEDPVMHLAYSISSDLRWIAVAWTDPWATLTKIEVFRFAGQGRTRASSPLMFNSMQRQSGTANSNTNKQIYLRNLGNTINEIWKRTATLCESLCKDGSQCQVVITKSGQMASEELSLWLRSSSTWNTLKKQEAIVKPIFLETAYDRPLEIKDQLIPAASSVMNNVKNSGSNSNTVSMPPTPGSATSPPITASNTVNGTSAPAAKPRNDSVIVSSNDETHGIFNEIFTHVLGSSDIIATGFLIKPSSEEYKATQGHQLLEVRLLHATITSRQVMKQTLGHFRRLANYAEQSGVSSKSTIMPWHLLAANKMVAALAAM